MQPETIDPGIYLAALIAAVYLVARAVVEWLIAPRKRHLGSGKPEPYDWPRWRTACR